VDKLRLSHTKITTWQDCHKKYYWTYVERLTPKVKAKPLQVGDITHKLHHLWVVGKLTPDIIINLPEKVTKLYPENTEIESDEVAQLAGILMRGYINQYSEDPLEFISSEVHIEVELDHVTLVMKIDALARPKDQRLWRVEHKTAGKMDSFYLAGLKGGLQAAIYDFGIEQMFHEKPGGTIYNILVKTKIPSYHRAYAMSNRTAITRMLQTVEGVYQEIQRADYFPSSRCFSYNNECEYKKLCDFDSPQVREAFYTERKEVNDEWLEKMNQE
jgi:hypothetical protein